MRERDHLSRLGKGKDPLNTEQLERPKEVKRLHTGQNTNVNNSINQKSK